MSTRKVASRSPLLDHIEPDAARKWIALAWLGFAAVLVLFLMARRLAGALSELLPPVMLLATAMIGLCWLIAVRASLERIASSNTTVLSRMLALHPPVLLVVLAVACSYPGGRIVDWIVWLPAIGASWWLSRRRSHPARCSSPTFPVEERSDQVLQQLTRARTAEGREVVSGTLTAEFAPGERSVTLHAAFCPPFERLPHVEAVADDDAATVKLAQVLHNGVRLDVRLAKPATLRREVCVELSATENCE